MRNYLQVFHVTAEEAQEFQDKVAEIITLLQTQYELHPEIHYSLSDTKYGALIFGYSESYGAPVNTDVTDGEIEE